jgi:hypothetical protein
MGSTENQSYADCKGLSRKRAGPTESSTNQDINSYTCTLACARTLEVAMRIAFEEMVYGSRTIGKFLQGGADGGEPPSRARQRHREAVACYPQFSESGLERAKGIEPSYAAWEAAVLPLNYAREIRPSAESFASIIWRMWHDVEGGDHSSRSASESRARALRTSGMTIAAAFANVRRHVRSGPKSAIAQGQKVPSRLVLLRSFPYFRGTGSPADGLWLKTVAAATPPRRFSELARLSRWSGPT